MKKFIARWVALIGVFVALTYAALNVDAIFQLSGNALAVFIIAILMSFVVIVELISQIEEDLEED